MTAYDFIVGFGIGIVIAVPLAANMVSHEEKELKKADNTVILCEILKDNKISNSTIERICADTQEGQKQ